MAGKRRVHIDPEKIRTLYQSHSMAEIARILGVGETLIYNRIKEYGITLEGVGKGGHRKKRGKVFSISHREAMAKARLGKRKGSENPNWRGGPITMECAVCGTPFPVFPSRKDTARFCSHACRGKWWGETHQGEQNPRWQTDRPLERFCDYCGIEFTKKKTEPITTFRIRRFCSKKCADMGGFRYSGESHPSYRPDARRRNRGNLHHKWETMVKSRDGGTCQNCGAKDIEIVAHHIKSYRDHPEMRFDVDNGITLCFFCHEKVHGYSTSSDDFSSDKTPIIGRGRGRTTRRWVGHCANCGKYLTKRWSDVKGYINVFCSLKCSAAWNWKHLDDETRKRRVDSMNRARKSKRIAGKEVR